MCDSVVRYVMYQLLIVFGDVFTCIRSRHSNSDSESECSQKSSTGKDFEMVNPDEVVEMS